jgi:hypothetical protein
MLGLCIGQAQSWVDDFGDDFLWRHFSHMLNVHAALRRDDERNALACAVCHSRDIVFMLNISAVFNEQATNFLTHLARLVCHELHAQNFAGEFFNLVDRACQFHATALTASARVNLRFHHPNWATQFLGGFNRFLHSESGNAAWHRDAELT